MRYGRTVEDGFLPAYSVGSEAEARHLLTMSCPMNIEGDFVAPELVGDQTLENLEAFGERLAKLHDGDFPAKWCECVA